MRPAPASGRVAEKDVFRDAELGKQQQFLIDRRDAARGARRPARKSGLVVPSTRIEPSVGLIDPGHDLDQRRFAGAVLSEQRMDLARRGRRTRRPRARARRETTFSMLAHLEQRSGPAGRERQSPAPRSRRLRARVSGSTTMVSTPASRSMASASGGAAGSVMSAWMRREGTNDEAAALGEFRSVRQNHQLVRSPQKFHLRARDQGIALDHAERADRDGAHEHDAG